MKGMSKKAKKRIQFFGCAGSRLTQMVLVNFMDTIDQIRVSWPHKWLDIYELINTTTKSTKLPPRVIRYNDQSDTDNGIYNVELLRLQRSGLHKIASRLVVLQITNVL